MRTNLQTSPPECLHLALQPDPAPVAVRQTTPTNPHPHLNLLDKGVMEVRSNLVGADANETGRTARVHATHRRRSPLSMERLLGILQQVNNVDRMEEDDDDDELKCPICFSRFVEPKVLPCCGHSICQTCENNISSRSEYGCSLNCPVCGTRGTLRKGALKCNYSLKNALELMNKERMDKAKCNECDQLVALQELFWCKTCNTDDKKLCSHCGFKSHKGHDIEAYVFVAKAHRLEEIAAMKRSINWKEDCSLFTDDIDELQALYKNLHDGGLAMNMKLVSNNCLTREEFGAKLDELRKIMETIQLVELTIGNLVKDVAKDANADTSTSSVSSASSDGPSNPPAGAVQVKREPLEHSDSD
ncbi:hypothetical protein QR680_004157 [Steinernema hermaphroditum]|uniref:RING-type domain-containing protein n=1 Tax=Steinernema hermaphroditum TaxID=289476 RepID=A0AA39HMU1_9BILA|nr:hypothetical protein QR680_004157 [Steinernema hermaphroditum]